MNKVVILLGGNEGQVSLNLKKAIHEINTRVGKVSATSSVYRTAPWGKADQPDFLNQVIVVSTSLSAKQVLDVLLSIELDMGRKRIAKWAPRLIDLDILYFNDEVIQEENLTVPHKHLHERRFVLEPLVEVLPGMIHPLLKKSNRELHQLLSDNLNVKQVHRDRQ